MWICGACGAPVDDRMTTCDRCGTVRPDGMHRAGPAERDEPAVYEAALAPEAALSSAPVGLVLRVEPPVASTLAVAVWCLAVVALFPLLGVPVALLLAVCSGTLVARHDRRPWDRRIGIAGLAIAVAAFVILGVWGIMLALRFPLGPIDAGEFNAPAARSWPVAATQVAVLVVSIVLHECGHAVAAYWSGDATAARQGRISLNPLTHIDPFGSIILPAILLMTPGGIMFGWAKPVPINPRQFRHPRKGLLAVTLAGVSINLLLALACASGLLVVGSALRLAFPEATSQGISNLALDVQLPGVSGGRVWELVITALKEGILVNMILFNFNILPIPPLDGFGVLESLAPPGLAQRIASLRSIGWMILIALIVFGVVNYLLAPGVIFALVLNLAVGRVTGWS